MILDRILFISVSISTITMLPHDYDRTYLNNINIPFEQSLGAQIKVGIHDSFDRKNHILYSPFMLQLKNIYTTHNLASSSKRATKKPKIPLIIHQIWLGSPLPEYYKQWQKTWQDMHPHWEYKLWTDEDVQSMHLYNQDLYDASTNYGERSDILRCEILYQMGGLYVDMDFVCIKPFDIFHHCYSLYLGIIGPMATGFLANGIIGSIPKHPILKHYLDNLPTRWKHKKAILHRSGPFAFADSVHHYLSLSNKMDIIAFPPTYFFPIPFDQIPTGECTLTEQEINSLIKPETFAVHYWTASWKKPAAWVPTIATPDKGKNEKDHS